METLTPEHSLHSSRSLARTTICAIGVVFGDIGTSPLYAMRDCFHGEHGISVTPDHIFGVSSLILWSLVLIVSIKYLCIVLRADNRGEGGILALTALARERTTTTGEGRSLFLYFGLFGAALLYGDGMITPAISVMSAVEGLPIAIPQLEDFVLPLTLVILLVLFIVQRYGASRLGAAFGPILLVWFLTMAVLGIGQIVQYPSVFLALSPAHAVDYLLHNGWRGFLVLGSVFLAVTGAETLYADMGHFGKLPIRWGWFAVALPSLALNYLGQAALVLRSPESAHNPFFMLAPSWAVLPLVGLATAATVIASQGLISGAFSLTSQAIQLGYLPRLEIRHTSRSQYGQVYVPWVNNALLVSTILMVLYFGSSKNIAAAYGVAVSCTMLLTTILVYAVMRRAWGWSVLQALAIVGVFALVEGAFFTANFLKVLDGGWLPLTIAVFVFTLMVTWRTGRKLLTEQLKARSVPLDQFFPAIEEDAPPRVPGTAVFMTRNPFGVPPALIHNLRHNKVLHERVVLMTVLTQRIPYVPMEQRAKVERLSTGFYRVILSFGFMEKPRLPPVMPLLAAQGLSIDTRSTTFFLGSETLLPKDNDRGMWLWREHLFVLMMRNAQKAPNFFDLPPQQVVEVGLQVEI